MAAANLSYPNLSLGDMAGPAAEAHNARIADPPPPSLAYGADNGRPSLSSAKRAALVVSLLVGMLFSTIDTSIVSTSLVTISHDLEDFANAPWIVLAYLLTYMGFAVCLAKLSDIYGRKNMIIVSWVIFIAFSMACAWSQTMMQLIIARAFQGLGGSGLYSMTQVGLIEVGPAHRPPVIGAMIGLTLAVAFVMGPLLGGLISQYSSWRWIFNINIPFGLVTILTVVSCWPAEERGANLFSWTAFRSIDFVGGGALLCASGFLVFGLQHGGSGLTGWGNPAVVATLVIAGVGWAVFIGWEAALSRQYFAAKIQPMFPIRLVKNRVYMGSLCVTLLTGFSHVALTVVIPERFQIVNGDAALPAGLRLLPLLGACALGSSLAGAVSRRRNNTAATLIAASALQLAGLGLMTLLDDPDDDTRTQYGYQTIFGLGVGLSYGAATILTAIHAAHGEDLAAAQGAVAQARVLGGCIGLAVCTVVFNAHSFPFLSQKLRPAQLAELRQAPLAVLHYPPELRDAVRGIYARAFAEETKIMLYVAAAMFAASFATFERKPAPLQQLTAPPPPPAAAAAAAAADKGEGRARPRSIELSGLGSVRSV